MNRSQAVTASQSARGWARDGWTHGRSCRRKSTCTHTPHTASTSRHPCPPFSSLHTLKMVSSRPSSTPMRSSKPSLQSPLPSVSSSRSSSLRRSRTESRQRRCAPKNSCSVDIWDDRGWDSRTLSRRGAMCLSAEAGCFERIWKK